MVARPRQQRDPLRFAADRQTARGHLGDRGTLRDGTPLPDPSSPSAADALRPSRIETKSEHRAMSARSTAASRTLVFPTPPGWLLGWWGLGRLVAIATALALKQSVWTLDRWDGSWYRMVARSGYLLVPGRQSDPAFFPLYPILLRIVHAAGVGWGVAGPLLSNLAFLVGRMLFYQLSRELFSEPLA